MLFGTRCLVDCAGLFVLLDTIEGAGVEFVYGLTVVDEDLKRSASSVSKSSRDPVDHIGSVRELLPHYNDRDDSSSSVPKFFEDADSHSGSLSVADCKSWSMSLALSESPFLFHATWNALKLPPTGIAYGSAP
jgi:hypothetical protein